MKSLPDWGRGATLDCASLRLLWGQRSLSGPRAGILLVDYSWSCGQTTRTQQVGIAADNTGHTTQTAALRIAVLPFDNLVGDPAQQFFSDGMTEEIAAALAKVPGLQLIARASAFQLRDEKDVRRVGQTLGARYVIKGSVRKAQNCARIPRCVCDPNGHWHNCVERQLRPRGDRRVPRPGGHCDGNCGGIEYVPRTSSGRTVSFPVATSIRNRTSSFCVRGPSCAQGSRGSRKP